MLEMTQDRNVAKFDDSKRTLAKLMAMENITVQIIAGVPTASFDPLSRVLTLPDWPKLTMDQLDTQIGHEVGHALFTDNSYLASLTKARQMKKHGGLMSYINVVEDARIERKMREAYPGLKATFYEGRLAFTQQGPIFETAGRDHIRIDGKKKPFRECSFIDRINYHYKIGAFTNIPFSEAEKPWIAEIDKAWSTERAIEIAEQLHELAKDEILKEQEQQKQAAKNAPKPDPNAPKSVEQGGNEDNSDPEPGDGEDGDDKVSSKGKSEDEDEDEGDSKGTGDGDDDGDSSDAAESGADAAGDGDSADSGKPKKTAAEKAAEKAAREALDPESESDNALAAALKALADEADPYNQIRHLLLKPLDESVVKERTITAQDFTDGTFAVLSRHNTSETLATAIATLESAWNTLYLSTADSMAQDFLQRKSAKNLLHARTGKTGRLDMNKLSRYKFADDLFKRVTNIPNGQSHGLCMIIDGSSSMSTVFASVLDQVLLFGWFCFKANIPFECYLFTTANDSRIRRIPKDGYQSIGLPGSGTLVGLINTTTNRAGFKRQTQAVLALKSTHSGLNPTNADLSGIPYVALGGTPLFAGMMIAERHIARMKMSLKLDKMMCVVISDGDDNAGLTFTSQTHKDGHVVDETMRVKKTAIVVRDTVTKKNFSYVSASPGQYGKTVYLPTANAEMTMFFEVLKARHDVRSIYMYLTGATGNIRTGQYAPHAATSSLRRDDAPTINVVDVQKAINEHGQYVLPPASGVADCCMVVVPAALQMREDEFAKWNARGASQTKVQNEFLKLSVKVKANRVFVNSVMPFVI